MSRYAIIVDPLSTGREYPAAFAAQGLLPVGVLSGREPVPVFRSHWNPADCAQVHYFDGDVGALAAQLRGYDPVCLVPGAETGVELYEALVPLVLPDSGNRRELAAARRDKWAMAQALRESGVPHLRQFCSADFAAIESWLAESGLAGRPVVVKPPKACGTDDVHAVQPGQDWRPVAAGILGKVNMSGLVNDAVLVQEFAPGSEFLVDSYSVDGRHGLVDVCRYTKGSRRDRIGIYERVDFLAPDHPDVGRVWPYVQSVLDAVGIRNGCGHAEVMLTPDGPRLIEVAERPAGGGHQMISELATGDNHIRRTVAHHTGGPFVESYRLRQHVRGVFISSPATGNWRNGRLFDRIEELPTFHAKQFRYRTGDPVPETVDMATCLGWAVLAGPDPAAIDLDYAVLQELQRQVIVDRMPVSRMIRAGNRSDSAS